MIDVQRDVPLAPRTTLELGGPAEYFATVVSEPDLSSALAFAKDRNLSVTILGGGSNVVIADAGIKGLVVEVLIPGSQFSRHGERVQITAGAGVVWDELVAKAVGDGLCGLECMSGIPGRVGGVPIQNVGAYGREVSDLMECVRVVDRASGEARELTPGECGFGYRDSVLKRDPSRYVVVSVTFALREGDADPARYPELATALGHGRHTPGDVRDAVIALRRAKSMVIDPDDENRRSVGSFFTNPIVADEEADRVAKAADAVDTMPHWPTRDGRTKLAAGWLVERAGFKKGLRRGAVGISSRHALALVHHGGGTTRALLALADEIASDVRDKLGVTLVREPVVLG